MKMLQKFHAKEGRTPSQQSHRHAYRLMAFDLLLLLVVELFIIVFYPSSVSKLSTWEILQQIALGGVCIFGCRIISGVYRHIWRYSNTALNIRLLLTDFVAGIIYLLLQRVLKMRNITFVRTLSIVSLNLLLTLASRFFYQYLYEYNSQNNRLAAWFCRTMTRLTGLKIGLGPREGSSGGKEKSALSGRQKINVAIVGAGRVGVMLAEELINNPRANYRPCCFVDIDREKIGRYIYGIQVLSEEESTSGRLTGFGVQEIIFALPDMDSERKKALYDQYKQTGCKIKVYDYPVAQSVESGRRQLREFDIEELLFRRPVEFNDARTARYYQDKAVLISGGGGSIGSELCRQIAKMKPRQLIILDVYENGAYDIQQELRIAYGPRLNLAVEIVSICDRDSLEQIFQRYRPQIVLHAAAHKHVPLMEHNCCEAVKNNVFGTLNMVEVSEKYGVEKFTMISTDKAVNPTNVMGATKRMCEMIVQSHTDSKTNFSATRFGNVLGSNGSVIPLFRRQIMNGGPITLTDKRIIRYFMTIPEASQLVLQSGAMARNGELYVLDMGKPVKILELAENMIRLSGFEPYKDIDIVETGLRPGEKLYEELLIQTETLDKTENSLIFVERDRPNGEDVIEQKLAILRQAVETGDDEQVRAALKRVVKTYHDPEEVNASAIEAREMQIVEPEQHMAV